MIVGVDPYLDRLARLLLRWLHVIAGIAWIGTSFYFVALDNHLRPPACKEDVEAGVSGESWRSTAAASRHPQVQGRRPSCPKPLHWYKWEAYTSGSPGSRSSASSTTSTRS
jgi:uncharacterized membrane protein